MTLSFQNYLWSSPCALEQYCTSSAIAVEAVYFLLLFRALLMHLSAVLVFKLMATLVNSLIFDSSWDVLQDLTSMDDLYPWGWQDYSTTSVMKKNTRPHAIASLAKMGNYYPICSGLISLTPAKSLTFVSAPFLTRDSMMLTRPSVAATCSRVIW